MKGWTDMDGGKEVRTEKKIELTKDTKEDSVYIQNEE